MNLSDLLPRLRALLFRRKTEAELEEEFATHLEFEIRKHTGAGLSLDEAARRARVAFGAQESLKEECRDARGVCWLSNVAQDLRYAIRAFRRAPGFTGFVIAILALGMGVNLATFSVTDAILLRLLPVRDPHALFRTVNASGNAYDAGGGSSYALFRQMRDRSRAFADLMAYETADLTSVSIGNSGPERLMQQTVSGNYFGVLGVQAAVGRMISAEDDREPGRHPVAVVSYRLWQDRFNGSPTVIGRKLSFNDHVYDIIGVAPHQFFGVEVGKMVDVWTPISMAPAATLSNDHNFWLRTMGRLKPRVSIVQATAPMQAAMNEFMLEDVRLHAPAGTPKEVIARFLAGMRIKGVPAGGGISVLRRQYEGPLRIMMFVVGVVMLIACSNVANLLIARGSGRRQEIAIRLSLGAGTARIVQQLLTENVLLAALSALAGLLVAHWATPALVGLLTPASDPSSLTTTIDLRLLAFTFLLTLMTVIICGLLPAVRLARLDVYTSLRGGRRLTAGSSRQARKILLTGQVALSLVLLVGAGLFTRTLVNLLSSYLGFNPTSVLVTRLTLKSAGNERSPFRAWSYLLQAVRSFPGLEHASLSSKALFTGDAQLVGVRTAAGEPLPGDPLTGLSFVSTDYFSTLSIGFVDGRDFRTFDELRDSPATAIVNQAFVRKFFGDQNPLGRKLTKLANAPDWTEIVGVVRDVKVNSLREGAPPMIYIPYGRIDDWIAPQAHQDLSMFLQVRGHQDVSSLYSDLSQNVASRFTIGAVLRQKQLIGETLVRERLLANVATVFAALALVLAGAGLYGITSYSVIQRRQELGVRIALGAQRGSIVILVLRDSVTVVVTGIVLGVIVSLLASHWTRSLLYGLAPNDTQTFAASAIVLLAGSLLAAYIPAYKAAKSDPMIALRHE
ncbi:MAG: ABC transporter permease [Bryobacteraceae bacterium]